ncbi:hypothetical protein ACU5CE_33495 [Priestia megaterium]|jgi:type II secretory pathway pseudopilin PulG|uniref:hypothetical protein n=1 Tax=Priestia megaterium TaxID=1404 RepID=UPI00406BB0EC
MTKKKTLIIVLIILVAAVLYFIQLNRAIANEQEKNKQLENQIVSLQNNGLNQAKDTTESFIRAFFSYDNTLDRYQNIKAYTTQQGYKSTFPSGTEPPTTGADIESRISDLEIFSQRYSSNEITTVSTFKTTTTFNDVPSNSEMVIKTDLVKTGSQWKVDNVEILSSQSTEN